MFSFGFNMETRKPQPRHIAWCDPQTKEWAVGPTNQAGTIETSFDFAVLWRKRHKGPDAQQSCANGSDGDERRS